jgi:hypothetical protein
MYVVVIYFGGHAVWCPKDSDMVEKKTNKKATKERI